MYDRNSLNSEGLLEKSVRGEGEHQAVRILRPSRTPEACHRQRLPRRWTCRRHRPSTTSGVRRTGTLGHQGVGPGRRRRISEESTGAVAACAG